jgi:hypothetical protein
LAQPYPAGSSEAEGRCIRSKNCQPAEPTHRTASTESYNDQAAAHTEVYKLIARTEISQSTTNTQATALGEAILCNPLIQDVAFRRAFARACSQTVSLVEASAFIKTWNFQAITPNETQARLTRCINHRQPSRAK